MYTIIPWELQDKLNYFQKCNLFSSSKHSFLIEEILVKEKEESFVGIFLFWGEMQSSELIN
jgi:hypothetical protein